MDEQIDIIKKKEYHQNKEYYLNLIKDAYNADDDLVFNFESTKKHLDIIFKEDTLNDAFLLIIKNDKELISMVNFFQYDRLKNYWSLFVLYTNRKYRRSGYGEKIMHIGLNKLKEGKAKMLISGIEEANIQSIELHKKIGFIDSGKKWDEVAEGFPKNHKCFIYNFD